MTPEEMAELNQRVAEAMGWRWQEDGGEFVDAMWRTADDERAPCSIEFCQDPVAANLVRVEIERRGWVWSISPGIDDDKYFSMVTGGTVRCSKSPYGLGTSKETPWHALCLAFLTAHDAQGSERE